MHQALGLGDRAFLDLLQLGGCERQLPLVVVERMDAIVLAERPYVRGDYRGRLRIDRSSF